MNKVSCVPAAMLTMINIMSPGADTYGCDAGEALYARPPPLAEVPEGTRRRTRGLGEGPQPDGLRAVRRRRPAHARRGDPRSRASPPAHGQAGRDPRLARCALVGHVGLQGNGGPGPDRQLQGDTTSTSRTSGTRASPRSGARHASPTRSCRSACCRRTSCPGAAPPAATRARTASTSWSCRRPTDFASTSRIATA